MTVLDYTALRCNKLLFFIPSLWTAGRLQLLATSSPTTPTLCPATRQMTMCIATSSRREPRNCENSSEPCTSSLKASHRAASGHVGDDPVMPNLGNRGQLRRILIVTQYSDQPTATCALDTSAKSSAGTLSQAACAELNSTARAKWAPKKN